MTFFSKKPCSYIVNNILFFMLFISCLHAVKPQRNEILHKAVLENNITELKSLLNQRKYDINEQNQFGFTPLAYAIMNNNIEAATLLLNQNADLDGPTPNSTPLMFFAVFSGSANMIDFLVSLGVDPSPTMEKIRKPIHTAILYGHTHLIQKLAESSPIPVVEQAETPSILALSAFYGYDAIVEYYLQKGCKATMIFSDIAPHFRSIPPRPSNLVYFACANNQYTTVKKLLKAGAPAQQSINENSPLIAAIKHNNFRIVKHLLKHGALPHIAYNKGNTAYHKAAKTSTHNIMRLLINTNADLNVPNNKGKTPLDIALEYNNIPACQELIAHGATITYTGDLKQLPAQSQLFLQSIPTTINEKTLDALFDEKFPEFLIIRSLKQNPINANMRTYMKWFEQAIKNEYHYAAHLIQEHCPYNLVQRSDIYYHENSIQLLKHLLKKENYYPHEIDILAQTPVGKIITECSETINTITKQLQTLKTQPLPLNTQTNTFTLLDHIAQHHTQETARLLAPIFQHMQSLPDITSNSCKKTIYTRLFILSCCLALQQNYNETIAPIYNNLMHKLNGYSTIILFSRHQDHTLLEKIIQFKKTIDTELTTFKTTILKAYLLTFPTNNHVHLNGPIAFPGNLDAPFFQNTTTVSIDKDLFDEKKPTISSSILIKNFLYAEEPHDTLLKPITEIYDKSNAIDLGGVTRNLFNTIYHCFFPEPQNSTPHNDFFFNIIGKGIPSMPTITPQGCRINAIKIPANNIEQKKYTDTLSLFSFFLNLGIIQARAPLAHAAKPYFFAFEPSYRNASFPWATICSNFIEHDPALITSLTQDITTTISEPMQDDCSLFDDQTHTEHMSELIQEAEATLRDYTITKTEQTTVLDALNNGFYSYLKSKTNIEYHPRLFHDEHQALIDFAQNIKNLTPQTISTIHNLAHTLITPLPYDGKTNEKIKTLRFMTHMLTWLNANDYQTMFKPTSCDSIETLNKKIIFINRVPTPNAKTHNLQALFKQALYSMLLENESLNAYFKMFVTGSPQTQTPITINFTKSGNNISHTCNKQWDISLEELMLYHNPKSEQETINNIKDFIKNALTMHSFNVC